MRRPSGRRSALRRIARRDPSAPQAGRPVPDHVAPAQARRGSTPECNVARARQPMLRLKNTSITKTTYTKPCHVASYLSSAGRLRRAMRAACSSVTSSAWDNRERDGVEALRSWYAGLTTRETAGYDRTMRPVAPPQHKACRAACFARSAATCRCLRVRRRRCLRPADSARA